MTADTQRSSTIERWVRRAARLVSTWVIGAFSFGLAAFAVIMFCLAFKAYDEASGWYARAIYQAQCSPGDESAGSPACLSLLAELPPDDGLPITDPELIRTFATSITAAGTALLTTSGLMLSAASLLFAVFVFVRSGPRERVSRADRGATP